jgi:alanyl-tRNA synthetase/misacylated tRNA(Ala) deacylase
MLRNQDRTRQELAKALGSLVQWRRVDLAGEGVQWATVVRTEEATHDFEFMGSLNAAAVENLPQGDRTDGAGTEATASPRYAFILHSSVVPMANNGITEAGSLLLITSNPPELAKRLGDKLKSELDSIEGQEKGRVKGGGAKGRWMGKITGKWSKADAAVLDKLESL